MFSLTDSMLSASDLPNCHIHIEFMMLNRPFQNELVMLNHTFPIAHSIQTFLIASSIASYDRGFLGNLSKSNDGDESIKNCIEPGWRLWFGGVEKETEKNNHRFSLSAFVQTLKSGLGMKPEALGVWCWLRVEEEDEHNGLNLG